MPAPLKSTRASATRQRALANGYRSGLEDKVANSLCARGCDFDYEQLTIRYSVPARDARYTPDFVLPNGIIVETKGLWDATDRQKIGLVKRQYPALDLRIVFQNPNQKISKVSKTSYADVCVKLGIPFAAKDIPTAWLAEPVNVASKAAIEKLP